MAGSSDLFKFPRTRHLFDAGGKGVSRDDLLLDQSDEKIFYSSRGRGEQHLVAVEEKVDGANLGISIGTDMRVSFQNRSHFINSKTHRQFNSLDSWLAQHSSGLYEALEPGRHVLFGEWLYAKHSIHYTKLPGYFLAFDIYDRTESRFLSRRERNRQLEGSGVPVVRLITEQAISGREEASERSWMVSVFVCLLVQLFFLSGVVFVLSYKKAFCECRVVHVPVVSEWNKQELQSR